jgi:DMSO/TMAO reductase YedYZ molybdopterin-dependent catalytic subunit
MEQRNFYILIASVCVGLTAFWLTAYNVVRLGIDPIEYIERNTSSIIGEEDEEKIIVTIKGNVKDKVKLTLNDIKSDKYKQVTEVFEFKNSYGTEWSAEYTGATLLSILEEEDILESDSEKFLFIGSDGYGDDLKKLSLNLTEDYENQIILAYLREGVPLDAGEGPIRSIIDREPIQDLEEEGYYCSEYAVKDLEYVEIY